ncbi:DUF3325 domain-containing protein [Paracidovorax cattleyae]|uniref:DUF3325 domain-containing protein n=1 Tax=Paracidovorax cattleyae TaxID=80868 RepID=UPI000AF5ECEA|nr:DUF3325 domain-containing protein [Paracidovorax cattleyae]
MSGGALTACAAACLGAAWWLLYLATRRVQDTLPTPISSRSVAGLRIVSAGLGTLAWLACAAADGIAMGTLLWAALWSASGFGLMALLTGAPRWMGRLVLASHATIRSRSGNGLTVSLAIPTYQSSGARAGGHPDAAPANEKAFQIVDLKGFSYLVALQGKEAPNPSGTYQSGSRSTAFAADKSCFSRPLCQRLCHLTQRGTSSVRLEKKVVFQSAGIAGQTAPSTG